MVHSLRPIPLYRDLLARLRCCESRTAESTASQHTDKAFSTLSAQPPDLQSWQITSDNWTFEKIKHNSSNMRC